MFKYSSGLSLSQSVTISPFKLLPFSAQKHLEKLDMQHEMFQLLIYAQHQASYPLHVHKKHSQFYGHQSVSTLANQLNLPFRSSVTSKVGKLVAGARYVCK